MDFFWFLGDLVWKRPYYVLPKKMHVSYVVPHALKGAANVDDEESSDGGDEDQASPSRRSSQAEFR